MVSMLDEVSILYLVGRVPETRGRPSLFMLLTYAGFCIGYGLPGHVMAKGRQMSMGDAGAARVQVWSKATTAWSHGGDQTKKEPLRGLVDDHARYRQGMEICRAGAVE